MQKRLLSGVELIDRAVQLGICIYREDENVPIGQRPIMAPIAGEFEIQRRVMEAERHIREHRLWIAAAVSAFVAIVSAIAAWVAVFYKSCQ